MQFDSLRDFHLARLGPWARVVVSQVLSSENDQRKGKNEKRKQKKKDTFPLNVLIFSCDKYFRGQGLPHKCLLNCRANEGHVYPQGAPPLRMGHRVCKQLPNSKVSAPWQGESSGKKRVGV